MKYYLIAGEPSGDLHGSNLIKGLLKADPEARLRFWGGDLMAAAGGEANLAKHYRETSFFGIVQVLKNLRTIKRQMRECRADVAAFAPDVLILVDYPGFNIKMARWAKEHGIRTFYYIAPKVWAWREWRVKAIRRYVDRLFVIFPFECGYFPRHGVEPIFEGNPLVDAIEARRTSLPSPDEFRRRHGLDRRPIIALLAGSRRGEIRDNLPLMADLSRKFPEHQFVVAGVAWLDRALYEQYGETRTDARRLRRITYGYRGPGRQRPFRRPDGRGIARTGNEITKSYGRFHDTPARRRTADRRRPAGKAVPDADRGLQHHAARKEEKRRHRGLIFVHAAPPRDYGSFMDPIYGRPGTDRPDGHAGSDLRNLPAALRRLDARSGTTVRPQLKITKDNAMKIICIARNYAAHAEELDRQVGGGTPCPPEPAWFLKPDTALLRNNDPFYIPAFSQEVHYECELVVRINRVGKGIAERFAHRYYDQVGLGIDFTARDLQRQAIAEGLPWERCKAFDRSAALSPQFVSLQELGGDVQSLHFTLEVNGQTRQRGDTSGMLFSVDRIIASVSQYMTLRMGDLLYTGTPAGVEPVRPGDNLRAVLEGRELLNFDIR